MIGGGKYNNVRQAAMEQANAKGAIVIIFEGNQGNGFFASLPADKIERIPSVLREVADQIERDVVAAKGN